MYRQTTRSREQIARMIAARDQRRIEQPPRNFSEGRIAWRRDDRLQHAARSFGAGYSRTG